MARDPGSVWAPLPEAGAPDGYTKTQFIVHSTGDNKTAAATRDYFNGPTLNESTFIVGWGPEDPTLQIMDSTDNADANGSANQRGISVEVVGDGIGGYNAWQRSEIIRLARWSMANHPGILPRIIPSEPAAGLGWHVMFGAPGPWAKVAKSCPGKQRIAELKADIFPAIFAGQEDDMDPVIAQKINEIHGVLFEGTGATPRHLSVYARLVDVQTALTNALPTLVAAAQKGGLDSAAVVEMLRPVIAEAVALGMAADNEDQAEEIVDRLAARLGNTAA